MIRQPENQDIEVAPPIKLIIFDCDGVLVDSEIICVDVLISELKKVGVDVSIDYFHQHFLGRSFAHVNGRILDSFNVDLGTDFESNYQQRLLQVFETKLQPTTDVRLVLEQLQTPYCLATSSSVDRTKKALELTGLSDFFDGKVFTASLVKNGKPAPDLFLFAAQKMGVKPENCLVIEDSIPGLKAAQAAGMLVWQYLGGSHMTQEKDRCAKEWSSIVKFSSWKNFDKMAAKLK
jgi:HAD superfamily hydrolase (TIGR01509 family)